MRACQGVPAGPFSSDRVREAATSAPDRTRSQAEGRIGQFIYRTKTFVPDASSAALRDDRFPGARLDVRTMIVRTTHPQAGEPETRWNRASKRRASMVCTSWSVVVWWMRMAFEEVVGPVIRGCIVRPSLMMVTSTRCGASGTLCSRCTVPPEGAATEREG